MPPLVHWLPFLLLIAEISAIKLPTAFSGVIQEDELKKKGGPSHLPTVRDGCFNEHECCDSLRTMGQCVHHRDDLKVWCAASCGLCQPAYDPSVECNDRHRDCAKWSKEGKCAENEYWMNENCRRSCKRCWRTRAVACPGTRLDCSKAPTPAIRRYCEQLQRWDEGARKSTILTHEPALPPGSHSLADLAP
ncbi:hypothetical protein M3Y99_01063000 [Aphelenchoides fujianensis]|nr:hypothetical protein M3Y99_01063000 [Aphelenchoides fujianensis]